MPIHCDIPVARLSADEFKDRDYRVMGHAFACQNELGRMCDECVYEADLAERLRADGFREVHVQTPVYVVHRDFSKPYLVDLIADNAMYELKTVSAFAGKHKAQLFNYMLLLDLAFAKLLNFRSGKVQGQLMGSTLSTEIRRSVSIDSTRWRAIAPACDELRESMECLLADWGAFLEVSLYQEALTHFLGGTSNVAQRVPIARGQLALGTQGMHLHAPGVAFAVTAFTSEDVAHEASLRKLLALTPLNALQWLNLDHSTIRFVTLAR